MDKLPADVLVTIFGNLSVIERIKLEGVCKRWKRILKTPCTFSDLTRLDIGEFLSTVNTAYYQQSNLNLQPLVAGLVRRGGPYIRDLTFGQRWLKISQPIIDYVVDYCPQLRSINLDCSIIDGSIKQLLKALAPKLEELSITETSWTQESFFHGLGDCLPFFTQIRKLDIGRVPFDLNTLVDTPDTIEFLNISSTKTITSDSLVSFFQTHPAIKHLQMSPMPYSLTHDLYYYPKVDPTETQERIMNVIMAIGCSLEKLETLKIGYIPYGGYVTFLPFTQLKALKILDITNCECLTYETLDTILSSIDQLEEITIVNCTKVKNYSPLGSLKKLKYLHVEKSAHVCDLDLADVAANKKLKILKLRQCMNVTDRGVATLIENCALTEIDLTKCQNITDKSIFSLVYDGKKCHVRSLLLNTCPYITGKGIQALASSKRILRILRELDVTEDKYVTNDDITAISKTLRLIKKQKPLTFQPLTCYVTRSGISQCGMDILRQQNVGDTIELVY